ncbi:ornithine carbamoyltransferase [Halarchaeum acidiphilum MH1-52-1]|uniref:Ornithine carbamoyltransferase n=1 Tax=Halarchaeum acidiphilum MH1-52-1 TaxID=1261545 RepID=U2YW77_9EURY|nr:ornithine carbamoyltransferase [Halarchaeum acidiphilum]GAD53285.1 ornithine carbamoyltransferase [Halarchaeum acidiphilum MH1-52-1]
MNLIDIDDFDVPQLHRVLDTAAALKAGEEEPPERLDGASLGMLFERPSTRTRVSFEVGMTELGGHAVFLGKDDIQLGRGEPIKDTARALSGYVDGVMARVKTHEDMLELAEYADVPVINGLSSEAHPAQIVADLLTIREHCGFEDTTVAWVGDGNNVGASFLVGAAMVGLDVTAATPEGYEFAADAVERAKGYDGDVTVGHDPDAAVEGADVVYTDVWVSMGEEEQREEKVADFAGFQLNEELLANADDARVMHCLPAHRGEEITDDVMESDRELIWAQAENRLHGQKGLLVEIL